MIHTVPSSVFVRQMIAKSSGFNHSSDLRSTFPSRIVVGSDWQWRVIGLPDTPGDSVKTPGPLRVNRRDDPTLRLLP